eukprot:gnl/MRDRNA2_/MRDRNA2_19146_c0_seq1.p1 gnl/MRDRNA2_/MRDRNA2_19146_c0~~gnl/MRDRNA2_/MRDRNA2_19146_c0_seq1.p1  ORF type:complete len:401 (+),score=61.44 gnl/MRDRNA2_/MRDRNA2_19146_c0_seq1:89-1291(+)
MQPVVVVPILVLIGNAAAQFLQPALLQGRGFRATRHEARDVFGKLNDPATFVGEGWPVQPDKIDWAAGPLGWFQNSVGLAASEEDKVAKRLLQGINSLCSHEISRAIALAKRDRPDVLWTDLVRMYVQSSSIHPFPIHVPIWPLGAPPSPESTLMPLDWQHGLFQITDVLTSEECEDIIRRYDTVLTRGGAHAASGVHYGAGEEHCEMRHSSTAWSSEPPAGIVSKIEKLTGVNSAYFEQMSITRYEPGGFLSDHDDSAPGEEGRVATVLIYLNDAEGGATYFPHLNVRVQPRRGTAVLFFPLIPGTTRLNPWARHCAEDTGSTKWVVQQWIRWKPLKKSGKDILADGSSITSAPQAQKLESRAAKHMEQKAPQFSLSTDMYVANVAANQELKSDAHDLG